MIDSPTVQLPTNEELELWELDLGKRIVREGRDDRNKLIQQQAASLSTFNGTQHDSD